MVDRRKFLSSSEMVVFDFESSGLPTHEVGFRLSDYVAGRSRSAPLHRHVQALQIYASNHPAFAGGERIEMQKLGELSESVSRNIFIRPLSGNRYIDQISGRSVDTPVSKWVSSRGILGQSLELGKWGEEEAVGAFYSGLQQKVSAGEPVTLAAWNAGYDLTLLDELSQRYPSLHSQRSWFQEQLQAGQIRVQQMEEAVFAVNELFAKHNPESAKKLFRMSPSGKIASSLEDFRGVGGWSLENVVEAMGGREAFGIYGEFHNAEIDAYFEGRVYDRWAAAHQALTSQLEEAGKLLPEDFTRAFQKSGILNEHTGVSTAEQLYGRMYGRTGFAAGFRRDAARGAKMADGAAVEVLRNVSNRPILIGAAVAAGASIAAGMAFGKRRDRQTQMSGFDEKGLAAKRRKTSSDFGSGYRGLDEENGSLATALSMTGTAGMYAGHRYAIRRSADYAEHVYRGLKTLERRFPAQILNTFSPSQLAASYMTPSKVSYAAADLTNGLQLTRLGEHFQRLLPGLDIGSAGDLTFEKIAGSPYSRLAGTDYEVRFAQAGRWTGASSRLDSAIDRPAQYAVQHSMAENPWTRWKENFVQFRLSQKPLNAGRGAMESAIEAGKDFDQSALQPLFARKAGDWRYGLGHKIGTIALDLAERPQNLLAGLGLGLKAGTWNKAFHVPFVGSGGLVNQLLTKRVLPAYLGLTALKYGDYLLGHHPSEAVASLPLKLNVARAELTDRVPGARAITDWYDQVVPGEQYGPLALPLGGAAAGAIWHYKDVLLGKYDRAGMDARKLGMWGKPAEFLGDLAKMKLSVGKLGPAGKGLLIGSALMVPFIPGMIGSRESAEELRAQYSGEEPIAVRSGRWWDVGNTPFGGSRIKYFRQHWFARMQARPYMQSTYGSEKEYWSHNPVLHPIRYLRDPNWLEKKHYQDRPYPVTSPAFADVPLIGPALASTVGRVVKPVRRMHEREWDGRDYILHSRRTEPRGPDALPVAPLSEEFSLKDAIRREANIAADFIGLPGFLGKTIAEKILPESDPGKHPVFEGSRNMTSASRRYYEEELGAMLGPSPEGDEMTGYSEALRRFVQREDNLPSANEIPNQMPSWLPRDYMVNFGKGDPYSKVQQGYMRLPGAGYESLNPDLKGIDPEDYPDWHKFKILADVAPYSTEFFRFKGIVGKQVAGSTESRIEYQKILDRVEEQKKSSAVFDQRHFGETEKLSGRVKSISSRGVELEEQPGRIFPLSGMGMSAADLSAVVLGEANNMSRSQVAREVDSRQRRIGEYLSKTLKPGTSVDLVVRKGAADHAGDVPAVVYAGGTNVNRELTDQGLSKLRDDLSGPEYGEIQGRAGQALGKYAESLSYALDADRSNPLRYIPTPAHSKLWQQRTPLAQYLDQEVYGSRMRRWHKPIREFVGSWFRGAAHRLSESVIVPEDVEHRRELETMVDQLEYLRSLSRYTNPSRTAIGANLFGDPAFLRQTLSRRDKYYFNQFLNETDTETREKILESAPAEMANILSAQWVSRDARVQGKDASQYQEGGRLRTKEAVDEYEQAETKLDFGDWERSKEVAEFFFRHKLRLPDQPESPVLSDDIDYEDVKAKIVQEEGYDLHDFGIFDDRADLLWRKPYLDGAVRELTSGDSAKSAEEIRKRVERMILAAKDKRPDVRASVRASRKSTRNIRVRVEHLPDAEIRQDILRNREEYE